VSRGRGRIPGGTVLLLTALAAAGAIPSPTLPQADVPIPGHTGGFGEDDCTVCHLEAGPNLPGGSLVLLGLPEGYEPGSSYELEVVLEADGTAQAGFQLTARHPDGSQAGAFAPVDGGVQILSPDSLVADYVAQTVEGSEVADPSGATWRVHWTAPPGSGSILFHLAANSANGDQSPLGDLVYTAARRIQAAASP